MRPSHQVAALYERWPQSRTFEEDVAAHRVTGHVVDTSEFFLMGRAVDRFATAEWIADPWHFFAEPNTWLVYAYAGDRAHFLAHVPYPLPWIAFQRRNHGLRYYDYGRLTARIEGMAGRQNFRMSH